VEGAVGRRRRENDDEDENVELEGERFAQFSVTVAENNFDF
jgi:hypothetical protein